MAGLLTPDPVSIELRSWASQPFVWGKTDCGLSVLAYAERVTGKAYQRHDLHHYTNEAEAAAFLRSWGGYLTYCSRVMGELGWTRTKMPVRGDVGLIKLGIGVGLTASLCLGDGVWAARGDRETVILRRSAKAAWRVPCLKQ